MNKILSSFGMSNSLMIYNIITTNPVEIVVQILMAKLGLSKIIITVILLFLL